MELLEKVLSKEDLNNAYKQVYKNKGASGVDGVTTDELFAYIKKHKEEILWQIRNRKYKPQPVRRVYIPKENGKMRKLGIPSVIDRVIQQAIIQVLTPIYEEKFSNNSYGFRPNRSCEMAVVKVLECFNDGYDWVVDIDLQSFFDEVNQDKLIGIIRRTIKDGNLVSLIRKFLQSGVMEKGVIQETKKRTPQGGNLSPLLSNIMLNELDKELEKRELNFVRYADDCLIMIKSEKALRKDDLLFCGAPHLFIAHEKCVGKWAEDSKVNCNITSTYFELLANAFGLGTVIMSYPAEVLEELAPIARKMLGIPEDHYMKLIVGFGYPEIKYARGTQKNRANKIHRYTKTPQQKSLFE